MVLQTFLLLDLWSKDNGLGGVTLISIKSAPKIYLLRVVKKLTSIQLLVLENSTKIALMSQAYETMLK